MRAIQRQAFVLVAAAFCAAATITAHAHADTHSRALVGMWLVEPESFDFWPITKKDSPWFPLLVIRDAGDFTLFRLAPACEPFLAEGQAPRPEREQLLFEAAHCTQARREALNEGFMAAYLHVSAVGRWSVDGDGRLTFSPQRTGPTPHTLRARLSDLAASLETGIASPHTTPKERAAMRSLQEFLAAHGRRLATLYSTFYVFDGQPTRFAVNGGRLDLTGPDGSARLAFRTVRPEPTDAAIAVQTQMLDLRIWHYFRCMLPRIERDWPGATPPTAEFGALAAKLRALAPDVERGLIADWLRRAGRTAEAAKLWSDEDQARLEREHMAFERHPARLAALDDRFGAYLGCPDADVP